MSFDPPPPLMGNNGDAQNPWARNVGAARFERDKFFVNRKLLSLGNKYHIYDELDHPLFFVDRPVLAVKAQFTVYEDESKSRPLLTINQESALAVMNYSFEVKDGEGNTIGWLKRQGWKSMLRRTWHVIGAQEEQIALAMEDSMTKAIFRKLFGHSLIGMMFLTNFIVVKREGEPPFGEYIRRMTITDKHVLDLSNDPERTFDRRLALALAVVLDNTEHQR